MKNFKLLTLLAFLIFLAACEKDEPMMNPDDNNSDFGFGLDGGEDLSKVPVTTNFGFGNGNLPEKYDISEKFPPIGQQGQFGTCVAWATGYYTKTALNGMDLNYSQSDLSDPAKQFSPKDLYLSLPDQSKSQCLGTNFSTALDQLMNRGVATMQTVPYTSIPNNCPSSAIQPAWTEEAAKNKIKYWRKVDADVNAIKQNVSNNIPVIFGAKLSDNFVAWNSDDVVSSTTTYDNVGFNAYHAMVVTGYDDNKGPNGAFRVINSWGTEWADNGFIWIDYNFFLSDFVDKLSGYPSLFIAANGGENENTPPDEDNSPVKQGVDLAPWVFFDYSNYDNSGVLTERKIEFNLYNIGTQDADPSAGHELYYVYFNAYDANDYGILFYDQFNESIEAETFQCPTADNCIINTSIPAQGDFASKAFGTQTIERTYYVPEITGDYYFLLVSDATDVFQEEDEINNFFYTSIQPVYIDGGFTFRKSNKNTTIRKAKPASAANISGKRIQAEGHNSIRTSSFSNAYSTEEIKELLIREKKSGRLDRKIQSFREGGDKIYNKK